jgi:hypothetical protein
MNQERHLYGNYVAFSESLPDAVIIEGISESVDHLIKSLVEGTRSVGEIDLDTLEIIFKTDKQALKDPLGLCDPDDPRMAQVEDFPYRATVAVKAYVVISKEEATDES